MSMIMMHLCRRRLGEEEKRRPSGNRLCTSRHMSHTFTSVLAMFQQEQAEVAASLAKVTAAYEV